MVGGEQRRVKVPLATGNKYVGLVFVFSTATGELLAIFPTGLYKRFASASPTRSANILRARIPRSWPFTVQAGRPTGFIGNVQSIADQSTVFSPTKEKPRGFVQRMRENTGAELRAVSSPEAAARGAEIVALATNALEPFFFGEHQRRHAYHHGAAERDDARRLGAL
jgi:hypothetical protein